MPGSQWLWKVRDVGMAGRDAARRHGAVSLPGAASCVPGPSSDLLLAGVSPPLCIHGSFCLLWEFSEGEGQNPLLIKCYRFLALPSLC